MKYNQTLQALTDALQELQRRREDPDRKPVELPKTLESRDIPLSSAFFNLRDSSLSLSKLSDSPSACTTLMISASSSGLLLSKNSRTSSFNFSLSFFAYSSSDAL